MSPAQKRLAEKEWGQYAPKKYMGDATIPMACVQRWKDQERYGDEMGTTGFWNGVKRFFDAIAIIILVVGLRIRRGEV